MAWRILQGMSLGAISLNYAENGFELAVRLVSPYDETEDYKSKDIDDAVVLRHLGIIRIGGKGIFDGFFALRVRE